MTLTIAIGGAVLAVEPRFSSVLGGDARVYALLFGAVGLVNVRMGALAGDDLPGAPESRDTL